MTAVGSASERSRTTLALAHTAVLGGSSRSLALVIGCLREMGCEISLFAPPNPAQGWTAHASQLILWAPPVCNWMSAPLYSTYAFESSWDRPHYNFIDLLLLPARKALRRRMSLAIYERAGTLFDPAICLERLREIFQLSPGEG